jgi:hypothetical protein
MNFGKSLILSLSLLLCVSQANSMQVAGDRIRNFVSQIPIPFKSIATYGLSAIFLGFGIEVGIRAYRNRKFDKKAVFPKVEEMSKEKDAGGNYKYKTREEAHGAFIRKVSRYSGLLISLGLGGIVARYKRWI